MTGTRIDRRQFLQGSAGIAVAGAIATTLAGCGGSPTKGEASAASGEPPVATTEAGSTGSASLSAAGSRSASLGATGGSSVIPAYAPSSSVTPDLPATADGVMPGFFHYPANPVKSVTRTPANGGTITVMATASDSPVLPESTNKVWQQMNKDIGAEIKFISVGGSDYLNKFQTTIAGGDIPDMIQLQTVAGMPDLLAKDFADLSEFLGGDAVKAYPNLAAIPASIWASCVFGGRLYALPDFRGVVGNLMMFREDILKAKNLPTTISSGDDFRTLAKGLVDDAQNKYAFSQSPMSVLIFVQEMMGAPNGWSEQDGKFTSAWEAAESRQAVDIVSQMWQKDKVFHPDAFAGTVNLQTLFTSGQAPMEYGSYAVWHFQLGQGVDIAGYSVGAFIPPKWDGGGQATKYLRTAPIATSAIKKGSADRVQELLRVADYWAAPFGSTEYLLKGYGIEGRDYTLSGSDPVVTKGQSDTPLPCQYIVVSPPVLYEPGKADVAKAEYNIQKATVPTGITDPSVGLFSNTALTTGATINKALTNVISDVIQGRKKLTDFDSAVKTWKSAGGDKIEAEYAADYAKSH